MYEQRQLLPKAQRTVSGVGEIVNSYTEGQQGTPHQPGAKCYLSVGVADGTTPTLDVSIVNTIAGVDYVIGVFAQIVAVGQEVIDIAHCPRDVKAVYTIGGTDPDFSFEVHISR